MSKGNEPLNNEIVIATVNEAESFLIEVGAKFASGNFTSARLSEIYNENILIPPYIFMACYNVLRTKESSEIDFPIDLYFDNEVIGNPSLLWLKRPEYMERTKPLAENEGDLLNLVLYRGLTCAEAKFLEEYLLVMLVNEVFPNADGDTLKAVDRDNPELNKMRLRINNVANNPFSKRLD